MHISGFQIKKTEKYKGLLNLHYGHGKHEVGINFFLGTFTFIFFRLFYSEVNNSDHRASNGRITYK